MIHRLLLAGASALAIATAAPAFAEDGVRTFDIPAQPLSSALLAYSKATDTPVIASMDLLAGKTAPAIKGDMPEGQALAMLLQGTGLKAERGATGSIVVERVDAPQSGSAAGDGADGTVQALIVTAQKREEQIQDVPIAISAFTEKSLQEQKIEGGFDLLKAIPNVTFSKNNFTGYNFSIRGVGTKAVSATTDPGVAVSFNNVTLLQNRLFEQEYFDVERVEVLRGPQGTLYGRNATAGVINVISAKPNLTEFSGWVKGEVGNYHAKRLSAMVNVPLVEDKLALRIAGALTDRQGYDFNTGTGHPVNGRDLWSGRITVGFNPTETIRSTLVWERFNEDDDRSRTGKQLCHRDPSPTHIGNAPLGTWPQEYGPRGQLMWGEVIPAFFSQGCQEGSLYDAGAFDTPNGLSLPFVVGMFALGGDCGDNCFTPWPMGYLPDPANPNVLVQQMAVKAADPYGGLRQSPDLRVINSIRDPRYRARADVVEVNLDWDLPGNLTLTSQTAYDRDSVYSFQDYNRFNTLPMFNDSSSWLSPGFLDFTGDPNPYKNITPGGVFCDPQLGCSKSIAGFDISQAKSRQFTQEVRLQSNFSGPVNFSAGANYTRFNVAVDYYVMFNLFTAIALAFPYNTQSDYTKCGVRGVFDFVGPPLSMEEPNACPYIDPNPVDSINGDGHNYFRSKNPYTLHSGGVFGELYWQVSDTLKVTAGLRYNDDHKVFSVYPSQLLLDVNILGLGNVSRGYPETGKIKQHWGVWTGRLGVDWKPSLSFTDQTMVYAFYSRGYKGGGANPPSVGFNDYASSFLGHDYGVTFRPEFVNAFEVGSKNTLLGGAMSLNGDMFFYDYKDYQVSQIKDRTAVNENFNAKIWGLELETTFAPTRNLRLLGNLGYLDTAIGNGQSSINLMNRTQSNPDYVLVKPWVQFPSNCVVPRAVAEWGIEHMFSDFVRPWAFCSAVGLGNPPIDPATGETYDPSNYPELNNGAGLRQDLGGNELPNSPHWTLNIGAQYSIDFAQSWKATIRGDGYWQSQSWARVYNDNPYDKLHGWYNVNLSLWLERPEDDLKIEFYAKNLLDKTPITDAFLNSDDTGLTTNVFVLDPRLIGLSIRKGF